VTIIRIGKASLMNCFEKSISVGRAPTTAFVDVGIENTNSGLTAKDSSRSRIDRAQFRNVVSCRIATRKKQEFWGAKISIAENRCPSGNNYLEKRSQIEVTG